MNNNQFKNISCYEEFEIQCVLMDISKVDVLKKFGHKINDYYFFVSEDGIFNWFDLEGNHVNDPGILTIIICDYIPRTITKCIIPNSVTSIGFAAFYGCKSLKNLVIPNSVTTIGDYAFTYCDSLTSITISNSVTSINDKTFYNCPSLKDVVFKEKTLAEVKQMKNYPFGIKAESIIKCELH